MSQTPTKNILLLDGDGVVISPPYLFASYLERELGLTRDHTSPFFSGVFRDCLVGRADLKQVIAIS